MRRTGIEPATLRLQSYSLEIQDLIGVESSTIEPPLHLEIEEGKKIIDRLNIYCIYTVLLMKTCKCS